MFDSLGPPPDRLTARDGRQYGYLIPVGEGVLSVYRLTVDPDPGSVEDRREMVTVAAPRLLEDLADRAGACLHPVRPRRLPRRREKKKHDRRRRARTARCRSLGPLRPAVARCKRGQMSLSLGVQATPSAGGVRHPG